MKHLNLILQIIFLCLALSAPLWADTGDTKPIEVQVGQRIDYSTTAPLVFSADDTVLSVTRKNDTQVSLTGLTSGTTQVVFSDNGQLNYITVKVSTMLSASSLLLTPEFKPKYPFLLYQFNNSSNFTRDTFFQNPSYTNNATLDSPFIGHSRMRVSGTYIQNPGAPGIISDGTLAIIGGRVDFLMGSLDAAIGRQPGALISSVPGFGPRLRFINPFIRNSPASEMLSFFAGIQPQTNLEHIQDGQRKAGFNYSISRGVNNSIFQDFFNVGFVAYQPPAAVAYHYNGVLEGTRHFGKKVQLGGGAYYSNKSYGLLVTSIYQTNNNLSTINLRFVRQGLEQVNGVIALSDQHNYALTTKKIFKDRITTLDSNISHQITNSSVDGATPSSHTSNLQLNMNRQYTVSRRYGGNIGFNRTRSGGVDSYSNTVSGNYAHPFTKHSYFEHSLAGNHSYIGSTPSSRQIQLTNQLQYENLNARHQLGLTTNYADLPNSLLGITLNGITSFFFRGGTFQFSSSYTKVNILNDIHQVQFGPSLLFQPTSTQLISLNSSANYVNTPPTDSFGGSFQITYRRYMGPGVVHDSLFKRVFKISPKVRISGRVFTDTNYNGQFGQGDIGLENVPLTIDGKQKTITGPGGVFTMANITPGQHTIVVETSPIQNINKPVQFPVYVSPTMAKREIPLPVQEPKATVTVRTLLDSNDNSTSDNDDPVTSILRVDLIQGEQTRTASALEGGTIFNGVDIGTATVVISPVDIDGALESISPMSQTVTVDDYKEYVVNFLFKAIRGIRGRVIVEGNDKVHPKVTIKMGGASATPDKEGYYWLEDLKEGVFDLIATNIPRGYCVVGGNNISVQIFSPFSGQKDIVLTTQCDSSTNTPPASPPNVEAAPTEGTAP